MVWNHHPSAMFMQCLSSERYLLYNPHQSSSMATWEVLSDDDDQHQPVLETPPTRRPMFASPTMVSKEWFSHFLTMFEWFYACHCFCEIWYIYIYIYMLPPALPHRRNILLRIARPQSLGPLTLRTRPVGTNTQSTPRQWTMYSYVACIYCVHKCWEHGWTLLETLCHEKHVASGGVFSVCWALARIDQGNFILWGDGTNNVAYLPIGNLMQTQS